MDVSSSEEDLFAPKKKLSGLQKPSLFDSEDSDSDLDDLFKANKSKNWLVFQQYLYLLAMIVIYEALSKWVTYLWWIFDLEYKPFINTFLWVVLRLCRIFDDIKRQKIALFLGNFFEQIYAAFSLTPKAFLSIG